MRHTYLLEGDEEGNRLNVDYEDGMVTVWNSLVERPNHPDPMRRRIRKDLFRIPVNRLLALTDAIKMQMDKEQ